MRLASRAWLHALQRNRFETIRRASISVCSVGTFQCYDRKKHDAGYCNYVPLNLGEVPDYYRRFLDPVDIAILKTCPMDDVDTSTLARPICGCGPSLNVRSW